MDLRVDLYADLQVDNKKTQLMILVFQWIDEVNIIIVQ